MRARLEALAWPKMAFGLPDARPVSLARPRRYSCSFYVSDSSKPNHFLARRSSGALAAAPALVTDAAPG
jgi:hypothetical protein